MVKNERYFVIVATFQAHCRSYPVAIRMTADEDGRRPTQEQALRHIVKMRFAQASTPPQSVYITGVMEVDSREEQRQWTTSIPGYHDNGLGSQSAFIASVCARGVTWHNKRAH
jgi:hypothetical protein